MINQAQSEKMK